MCFYQERERERENINDNNNNTNKCIHISKGDQCDMWSQNNIHCITCLRNGKHALNKDHEEVKLLMLTHPNTS